jgi:cell filamentation protein
MTAVDPYFDESIGDLRNLLGVKSSKELKQLEPQIVFANELELEAINIPRTNDLTELLQIHKQLFKGVYDWAGRVRIVDIKKNSDGSDFFLIVSKIIDAANYVFAELAKEQYLQDLTKKDFIKRLAYFYDQLNYIHPFREGNGRTQRVFWSRVAKDSGYAIDWSLIKGHENDEASRLAAEDMLSDEESYLKLKMILEKERGRTYSMEEVRSIGDDLITFFEILASDDDLIKSSTDEDKGHKGFEQK